MLSTAAYYGDLALYNRFFSALQNTQDTQAKQRLLAAMASFHDRTAIEAGFQAVLEKKIPMVDGFSLLLAGQGSPDTRNLSFEFVKQHFGELTAGHPSIFGTDAGSYMPFSGRSFCDTQSRDRFQAFFAPLVDKYAGRAELCAGAGRDRSLHRADDCAGGEREGFFGEILDVGHSSACPGEPVEHCL